jgi:hypothetical protein
MSAVSGNLIFLHDSRLSVRLSADFQWLEVRQICIVKLCRELLPCRVNLSGESLLYLGAAGPIYKGAVHRIIRFSVEGCKRLLWSCTRQKCLAQVDLLLHNLSHFSRAFINLILDPAGVCKCASANEMLEN